MLRWPHPGWSGRVGSELLLFLGQSSHARARFVLFYYKRNVRFLFELRRAAQMGLMGPQLVAVFRVEIERGPFLFEA